VALRPCLKPIHAVVNQGQLRVITHEVHLIPPMEFAWRTPRREGGVGGSPDTFRRFARRFRHARCPPA
jgi:hypothetical protein